MTTLMTPRLVLRPWRQEDLEPFAALNTDPDVMAHFPQRLDRAQSNAMAARIRAHFDREGFGLWAVEVAGVTPFIGFTGLARPAFRPEVIEIGWRLARPYWGCGYATEAAERAVTFARDALGLDDLVAFVVPANTRSQRVMGRLGMVRDPAGDFEHPMIPEGSPVRPHHLYRLKLAKD